MPPLSDELRAEVRDIRDDLVMSTLVFMLVAGTILFVGNMVRNLQLGTPLSVVHSLTYASFLGMYLLRKRLGANGIAWIIVTVLFLLGAAGVLTYGIAGNSGVVFMAFVFVTASFFGFGAGIGALVLACVTLLVGGASVWTGLVRIDGNIEKLLDSSLSWFAALATLVSMAGVLLAQVRHLTSRQMTLLHSQHHQARHDALTGLSNRVAAETILEKSIADARREDLSLGVVLLDLDRFKMINDSLGHHIGDQLLIEVGRRLQQSVRASDTVARLGGDEFLLILPRLASPEDAADIAHKLVRNLSEPYAIDGFVLHTQPSIGISSFPQDGTDVITLIQYADTAMYVAKNRGGGSFQYFSPAMNEAANVRLTLEQSLRRALRLGELRVHYQPKVDKQQRLTGLEALVRWQPAIGPLLSPDSFIGIAEESDLIDPLSDCILEEVCSQLRAWLDAGLKPVPVAVNMSARQLSRSTLPQRIAAVLAQHEIPAHYLEFELTESATMHEPEKAARVLYELDEMGFSLTIDDFGTGYSSLSHLRNLPLNALKIDKSFVANIAENGSELAIARSTIALAHNLGMRVVAEGVETPEQWEILIANGCDEMQGYMIGRPAPADHALAEALAAGRVDFSMQARPSRETAEKD